MSTADPRLSELHLADVRGSGLTDETVELAGLFTEKAPKVIAGWLNWGSWRRGPVLAFPFFEPGSDQPFFYRVKPDNPRKKAKKNGELKVWKYEQPKGKGVAPYLPPRARREGWLRDASQPLLWAEGEKKALCLDQLGYPTIGSTGVDCFHDTKVREEEDVYRLHPMILKHATVAGRVHVLVFDGETKERSLENVERSARRLAGMLIAAGAAKVLSVAIPPPASDTDADKRGIDDYFVAFGEKATRALLDTGQPIDPIPPDAVLEPLKQSRFMRACPIPDNLRMPDGYSIDREGRVWKAPSGPDGVDSLVEQEPVVIRRILRELYSDEHRIEIVFPRARAWVSAVVDGRVLGDARLALHELTAVQAPIDTGSALDVVRWLRALERTNARRLERTACVTSCGWHDVGDDTVFLAHDVIHTAGDDEGPQVIFDGRQGRARMTAALQVAGEQERHFEAVRRAFAADVICATVILGALAAPVLRGLGAPNGAVHLPGDSSRGKTTMLKIAASIYGNPSDDRWVAQWNSTAVGLEMRASTYCDLPLCCDEAAGLLPSALEQALYMLIAGSGRTRGARMGGLRETPSWRTVVLSTGERLAADPQTATGAQVRVLQLYVTRFGELDASGVDELRTACEDHHGHVGRRWLEQLVAIEDWREYREAFRRLVRHYQAECSGDGTASRQAGFLALLSFVERMAAEVLGIGDKEGRTVEPWLRDAEERRERVMPAAERALDVVREWRQVAPDGFRFLERDTLGEQVPTGGSGRLETVAYLNDDVVAFLPSPLRRRLAEEGLSQDVVTRAWRERGWVETDGAGRCTRKMRVFGSRVRVVALRREVFDGDDDGPT